MGSAVAAGPAVSEAADVVDAVARHRIANLLNSYTDIADRKDLDAVVDLLGGARVQFPHRSYSSPDAAHGFFADLWAGPTGHRHDTSNLRVFPGDAERWNAHAHYTRWIFDPEPVLHTLGEYTLEIDAADWSIRALTVTRTWTKG
ncbi:hypothetical protein [Rhodococcoides fascians]|uniref:hypothetical protein n=1 Tax=Rhodococcoides fascians TaxID=1828 RepID=UPI000A9B0B0A|nr:hypothetical protein [Rhodococcus fascians]